MYFLIALRVSINKLAGKGLEAPFAVFEETGGGRQSSRVYPNPAHPLEQILPKILEIVAIPRTCEAVWSPMDKGLRPDLLQRPVPTLRRISRTTTPRATVRLGRHRDRGRRRVIAHNADDDRDLLIHEHETLDVCTCCPYVTLHRSDGYQCRRKAIGRVHERFHCHRIAHRTIRRRFRPSYRLYRRIHII